MKEQDVGESSSDRRTHTVYPVKCLLVTGDLMSGFKFYGSFDSKEKARQWAGDHLRKEAPYLLHDILDVRKGTTNDNSSEAR